MNTYYTDVLRAAIAVQVAVMKLHGDDGTSKAVSLDALKKCTDQLSYFSAALQKFVARGGAP